MGGGGDRLSAKRRLNEEARRFASILHGDPCCYCGSGESPTLDHIVPLIRGGTNDWDNLTSACQPCNCAKGSQTLMQFLRVNR